MSKTKAEILSGVTKEILSSKFVMNNTLYILYADGSEAWRLYNTDVVTKKDNFYTLNSGGWRTVTTKDRINSFTPGRFYAIYQENGIWYLSNQDQTTVFYDGIQLDETGKVISELFPDPAKEVKAMKKRIANFCNLITKNNLPLPGNGDCWYCLMVTDNGETLGDATKNYDHLLSHMEENYLHGSLLVNAMRERGYTDMQIGLHFQMKLADTFKRAVRRYLQKRLIPNVQTV